MFRKFLKCFTCCDEKVVIHQDKNNVSDRKSLETKSHDLALKNLQQFTFKGIECYCEIIQVVDGDTISGLFDIPLAEFVSRDYVRVENFYDVRSPLITFKLRCRINGLDAAEKNTKEGQIAKMYTTQLLMNKKLKCKLLGEDKYGRQLIDIYIENDTMISTTAMMLNYKHKEYGSVYVKYDGKTKSEKFKELTTYKIKQGKLIVEGKEFMPYI